MAATNGMIVRNLILVQPPNGSRLSCGALVNESFLNLRAPAASRSVLGSANSPLKCSRPHDEYGDQRRAEPTALQSGPGNPSAALAQVAVDLTSDDLREIEDAASKITVAGARYPEELERRTGL